MIDYFNQVERFGLAEKEIFSYGSQMEAIVEIRPSIFDIWLDRMADELGVDKVSRSEAAALLGKTERMIGYYLEGRDVPVDTQYLMDALLQGYRPRQYKR